MTMKRVVITGPTGAIGLALINQCIQLKVEVLALCRKGSEHICKIPVSDFVRIIECDISELTQFFEEKQYDVFYHLAWDGTQGESRNDIELQSSNVQYTLDAVQLADRLGCHTFVGAGSQAEYGRCEGRLTPETPTHPENDYGRAKLEAGKKSRDLCRNLGIKHIWVRILSVYGPYDDENTMVMSTILKLIKGEIPKCTEGNQIWDYLYSDDAANAMFLLGEKGKAGKTYCLGSGIAKPLKEYIKIIQKIVNENINVEFGAIPYAEQQVMNLCACIDELNADVGFSPSIGFDEGVLRILRLLIHKSEDKQNEIN